MFNKCILLNHITKLFFCYKVIMDTVFLPRSWWSCCVRNTESKLVFVPFSKFIDKSSFANTTWSHNNKGLIKQMRGQLNWSKIFICLLISKNSILNNHWFNIWFIYIPRCSDNKTENTFSNLAISDVIDNTLHLFLYFTPNSGLVNSTINLYYLSFAFIMVNNWFCLIIICP